MDVVRELRGRIIVPGEAVGPLMALSAPISFWGGLDPVTGAVSDPRHPDHGRVVTGTVLAIPASVGSSSSSAIMLELLREGTGPAALLLGSTDAIVALGVVVARELELPTIPVLEVSWNELDAVASDAPGARVAVSEDGRVRLAEGR